MQKLITDRLNIETTFTDDAGLKILVADGISFAFDTQGPSSWICVDVTVLENARSFESAVFFYMDWLEDILASYTAIDAYALRYMLFANGTANDLTYED